MNGIKRRSWPSRLAGVTLAAATLFGSPRADAGNVTVSKATAETKDTERPKNALYYVSFQDCIEKVPFSFAVTVTGSTAGFQVWASDTIDCKQSINRKNDGAGCTQLAQSFPTATGKVEVTADQLAAALDGIDPATCIDSGTSTAPRLLKIYFMIVGTDDPVADGDIYVWDQTQIDLLGPAPPSGTDIRVDPGDGLLILTLPTNTDGDKLGYYLFCSPNPNPPSGAEECTDGAGGAGGSGGATTTTTTTTSNDGGAGGAKSTGGAGGGGGGAGGATTTTTTSTTTTSTATTTTTTTSAVDGGSDTGETACSGNQVLACVNATHPSPKSKSMCGKVPASATGPVIKKLENGTEYVVAVAAYDTVNNIGPLSPLQCGVPAATKTFFNEYCAAGGVACADGCGTCAVGSERDLKWPGLAALALAGVATAVRRDGRRRRARAQARRDA